ncbi:MAG: hypothetical protein JRF63_08175, partial [Deltaproteobacteria bacterium]|nr:hypothetical protein [Deltaproteobacteria bacterium]
EALPADKVRRPGIPMEEFLQEAENLCEWCQADKAKLEAAGLVWYRVEELPVLTGAAREAESRWFEKRFAKQEAQRQWQKAAPGVFDLRNQILHSMRYAYRNEPNLLSRVSEITGGSGNADMIQDLNDAAVLGREHTELLVAIGFDLEKLDHAAELSAKLAELLAVATSETMGDSAVRDLRDRAYTLLKLVVDEIRTSGRYVFWRDPDRRIGYQSAYHRRMRRQAAGSMTPPAPASETSADADDATV